MLHLYRRLLGLRHATPALTHGALTLLEAPEGVLAYRRGDGPGACAVWINMTGDPVEVAGPGAGGVAVPGAEGTVLLASDDPDADGPFTGRLGPDAAVVIQIQTSLQ